MRDFLISLSGARSDVLARCPSERAKFEGIGGAVLTTSVLATISMWFALYSALSVNPFLAVPVAVIWGLIIMSLDRWLVGSIPADGPRRWQLAVPRVLMAILLGFIISTPLVLQIFRPEINAQIVEIQQHRTEKFLASQQQGTVGQDIAKWTASVNSLQKVIASNGDVPLDPAADPRVKSLTAERDAEQKKAQADYHEWQCQLYGGAGCTRKGNGPLAAASKAAYDKGMKRVNQLDGQIEARKKQLTANDEASKRTRLDQAREDLPKAEAQLSAAQKRENDLQNSFDSQNRADKGILIRLQALNQVAGKDTTLRTAQFLLFLLFLLIECLPVTVKLMQKPGNYEKILKLVKDREFWDARGAYGHGPQGGSGSRSPNDPTLVGPPDGTIRDIWYSEEAARTEEETLRPRRAPAEPPPSPTKVDSFDASGDQPSPDDMALREMDDVRSPSDLSELYRAGEDF